MPADNPSGMPLAISPQDVVAIDKYRRLKDTSVLTIMFTDIKGFTEINEDKGEAYSGELRQQHDTLLVAAIQEDAGGLVVKHIGDSVMAVFSEPSTAVDRALRIQERIRVFNQAHPEWEDLEVRIGLDMGQVAVENEIKMDLFGRHVNRASRVESLADGGQIYMTYPVVDSARGWLQANAAKPVAWISHGSYFLKGIKTPVEVYEVVDTRLGKPRAPLHGVKYRNLKPMAAAVGVIAAGAAAVLAVMWLITPRVWFVKFNPDLDILLDHKTKIILDGRPADDVRRVLVPISPGKHLLQMNIHYQRRYYMELNVQRGKNYIEPKFEEDWMPSLERRLTLEGDHNYLGEEKASDTFHYFNFDGQGQRVDYTAVIALGIKGIRNLRQPKKLIFDFTWTVSLNGKQVAQGQRSFPRDEDAADDKQSIPLYSDAFQVYTATCFLTRDAAELNVSGMYSDYK